MGGGTQDAEPAFSLSAYRPRSFRFWSVWISRDVPAFALRSSDKNRPELLPLGDKFLFGTLLTKGFTISTLLLKVEQANSPAYSRQALKSMPVWSAEVCQEIKYVKPSLLWFLYSHAESVSFDTTGFYALGSSVGTAALPIKLQFYTFRDNIRCGLPCQALHNTGLPVSQLNPDG